MPFIPDHVTLEHSTGQSFRLLKDLTYLEPGGRRITIRAGLITDMASVPQSLWSIVAPFGQQSLPAILHDQECTDLRALKPRRSRLRRRQRRVIDDRFLEALLERGVPRFRAVMMWAGASLGRLWDHGHLVQGMALILQMIAGCAAIVWGAFHATEPAGWVALGTPALLALAWGRSSPAILLAQYPGLGIILTGLVSFVLSMIDWCINVVFGARVHEPSPEQLEIEREVRGGHRGRRARRKQPFRGVGIPRGLEILP